MVGQRLFWHNCYEDALGWSGIFCAGHCVRQAVPSRGPGWTMWHTLCRRPAGHCHGVPQSKSTEKVYRRRDCMFHIVSVCENANTSWCLEVVPGQAWRPSPLAADSFKLPFAVTSTTGP